MMTQPQKIEAIFSAVAEYFGVNIERLKTPHLGRDSIGPKKSFVIYFLREYTYLTWEEIADLAGYGDARASLYRYTHLVEDTSEESYGDPRAKRTLKELKEYIKL